MTFGEKLKKLRADNDLTQEELADRLFVTRTAISKWETNRALPQIDNLKLISEIFGASIDELISDSDIQTKRSLDEKRAKIMYVIAISFLALATAFALLAYFLKQPYINIGGLISAILYIVFGLLSKPKYKRIATKKLLLPYILSRAVILLFVVGMMIFTIIKLI